MDRKRIFPILLIVFTNILGAGMIMPTLPLYAVGQFGSTEFQAALLASAYFGAQFFAAPWLGRLSDQHGRRPILIISQIGTVISFILFIFAGPIGAALESIGLALPITGGLFMMFVARTLDGVTGGNITTARAYITDVTPQETRTQSLGTLAATFGLAFIFGPAIGGLLGGISDLAPFIGATVITTITLLLTTFTLDESLPPEKRTHEARLRAHVPLSTLMANRNFSILIIIGFIGTLAFSAIPPIMSLYVDQIVFPEISDSTIIARNVGFMLSFMGIFNVLTQGVFLRPLTARFGERTLVLAGQFIFMLVMFAISMVGNFYQLTFLFAPFAFARGITDPPLQSLITRFGTEQTQGRLLGLYQSSLSAAMIIGPVWAGFVYQNIAPRATFALSGVILILSVVLAAVLRARHIEPAPQPVP